jgi:hypothetical protein
VKTGPDFRLSKSTKRQLALMPDSRRNHFKKLMIEAEVAEKKAKNAKINTKNQGEE